MLSTFVQTQSSTSLPVAESEILRTALFLKFKSSSISLFAFAVSFPFPLNTRIQGISRTPCGRSEENLLDPVVRQRIDPPFLIKIEQILEIPSV